MTHSDDLNDTVATGLNSGDRDSGYYAVDTRRVIQVFEMFQMRPSHFAASGKAGAQGVYYDAKKIIEGRTGNKWGHHTPRAIESFCHFTQSENGTLLPWRELIEHKDFYDGKEGAGRRTGNLLLTENRVQLKRKAMITARQKNELSLEQLAKKTALPIRFIEVLENGNWEAVTKDTANIIAKALGVAEENLFNEMPHSKNSSTDSVDVINSDTSQTTYGKQRMKKVLLLTAVLGLVLWASYHFSPIKIQNDLAQYDVTKLTGCWNWSNGGYILINADGTAQNGPFVANWKVDDISKGLYTIKWPSFVDTLTLADEGDALSGINNYGLTVTATRKSGNKTELIGNWLWANGVTIEIRSDFSFSGGSQKGTWRKSGDNWVLEWPLVDTVTLSENGLNLSVKNQFGSVTAKRDVGCKGATT